MTSSSARLWALAEAFGGDHPGYWQGIGTLNPAGRSRMVPDMQLGMIGPGTSRRFGGVFAHDIEGRVFAHDIEGRVVATTRPSTGDSRCDTSGPAPRVPAGPPAPERRDGPLA